MVKSSIARYRKIFSGIMVIIRKAENNIKDFLEDLLKQKRKLLLSEGYAEKRTDEIIEKI